MIIICVECGEEAERPEKDILDNQLDKGRPGPFCGRSCAGRANQRLRRINRDGRPLGEVEHGTESGYSYYGCRCDPCRAAHARVHTEYRRKRGVRRRAVRRDAKRDRAVKVIEFLRKNFRSGKN